MMTLETTVMLVFSGLLLIRSTDAFVSLTGKSSQLHHHAQSNQQTFNYLMTSLDAEQKKRKRKRKSPPTKASDVAEASVSVQPEEPAPTKATSSKQVDLSSIEAANAALTEELNMEQAPLSEKERSLIGEIAKFEFQPPPDDMDTVDPTASAKDQSAIPLPNIQDALQKKKLEQELAQMEEEQQAKRVKIKRSDKDAFTRLLEQQPFADADDSFFEEEEYGTVAALLGEKAKPFLGLPFGPLQVGHFIGALGIVLMAFVEYPGFPLTNLPTPLRQALQGGLLTVYSINTLLAIYSVFKASERGQPVPLWVAKTFSVGGLALDQLTQLPTLAQIEEAENRKGARALKKNKKR